MVEYNTLLDTVFYSLSDPTRREILLRVSKEELSISELAKPYEMSFAAVAKHIAILESASLVRKRRAGKQQFVQAVPDNIRMAKKHLSEYEELWKKRFEALDELLQNTK